MRQYDAVIVGGGPSGSATAIELSRGGHHVLLIDKATFPRDKACGDCVSGKSIKYLRELNVLDKVPGVSKAMSGIFVAASNGETARIAPPSTRSHFSHGYVVKRIDLDNILFQEAKNFCDVQENTKISELLFEGKQVVGLKIKTSEGATEEVRAKVVIGADGATSFVAAKLGEKRLQDWRTASAIRAYYTGVSGLTNDIELHFFKESFGGYFWIFPIAGVEGAANVGLGINMQALKTHKMNLTRVFKTLIKEHPALVERFANAKMDGHIAGWTIPSGHAVPKVSFDGALLVGDAAHLVDPFTGEGIGNALASAHLASQHLSTVLKSSKVLSRETLLPYEKSLKKLLNAELRASAFMHVLSRSDLCMNFLIKRLSKSEVLQNYVSSTIFNENPGTVGLNPQLMLKALLPARIFG